MPPHTASSWPRLEHIHGRLQDHLTPKLSASHVPNHPYEWNTAQCPHGTRLHGHHGCLGHGHAWPSHSDSGPVRSDCGLDREHQKYPDGKETTQNDWSLEWLEGCVNVHPPQSAVTNPQKARQNLGQLTKVSYPYPILSRLSEHHWNRPDLPLA